MKKLLSLLLACVMGLTLLAGCSNTDPSSSSNGQTDKNASQTISIAQSANFSMGFAPAVQSLSLIHIFAHNLSDSLNTFIIHLARREGQRSKI